MYSEVFPEIEEVTFIQLNYELQNQTEVIQIQKILLKKQLKTHCSTSIHTYENR